MTNLRDSEQSAGAAIRWENIACPLCGQRREAVVFEGLRVIEGTSCRIVRCENCGLGYLNPRPDAESIRRFYPADYEPYQSPSAARPGRRSGRFARLQRCHLSLFHSYPEVRASWWEKLAAVLLAPWLAPARDSVTSLPFQGSGRLLDVGCGSGWFAQRMRERGWDVTGLDFNAHAVLQARTQYGFSVHLGTLPHPAIAPASFDVVTMGCVLEHVHDPHQLIESAKEALRPGGFLAVTVPNFASWTITAFGRHCYHLDPPRHLLHFSPGSLRRLLEEHGLQVREQRMLGRASWMRRTLESVYRDESLGRGRRGLAWLANRRLMRSLLTRWTAWRGQADAFLMLAYSGSRWIEKASVEGMRQQVRESKSAGELMQVP